MFEPVQDFFSDETNGLLHDWGRKAQVDRASCEELFGICTSSPRTEEQKWKSSHWQNVRKLKLNISNDS